MHKKVKPTKYILLWCTPGFGVLDIWLPIVKKLKEKGDIKIDFVFPEPSSLRLEDKQSDLFNLAEILSDDVIYRSYSGFWFKARTLGEAHKNNKYSVFDEKIKIASRMLVKGRLSKYFFVKVIGKLILSISKYFIYTKEKFRLLNLYDVNLFNNADGILYDIVMEHKKVNKELRVSLKNIPKFSMFHGLAASWVMDQFICDKFVTKRSDVTVYTMSNLEVSGYKKCFGILDENLVHSGIPRHDSDWIEFICNQSTPVKDDIFDSFVLIIGRPASPYNTPERKKKALRDIYDVVCIKHKLKLVVKMHPKESDQGIDYRIYNEVFGVENYGKNWTYSGMHPFVLGRKSIFSITFFSGVAIDMLAINKPTIEYLNLEGLNLYDNSDSLRDEFGNPVFQCRYAKLVLGASSRLELERHVESILNQYEMTVSPLRSMYEKYFMPFDGASKMVANDIYKRIDTLKVKNI